MARFELRNATVRLVDGYANTAAVNESPVTAQTTLEIDTVVAVDPSGNGAGTSQVIPLSSRFTVVGSTETYTVTAQDANAQLDIDLDVGTGNYTITIAGQVTANIAHTDNAAAILAAIELLSTVDAGDFTVDATLPTIVIKATATGQYAETAVAMSADVGSLAGGAPTAVQTYAGGVTHQVTFTPALLTADGIPADDAVITFVGRQLEMKIGDGNFSFTEAREFIYDKDRGLLDAVRQGEDVPINVSIDFVWEFLAAISGATTPTPADVLHRRGAASGWKSTADSCEPFALDIEISNLPPCGNDGREDVTLPDFRWESLDYSGTDAQLSMTGQCNATEAIVARAA